MADEAQKIQITPKMLFYDIADVSLENVVNNKGELLKSAMEQRAKSKQLKLVENFWDNHEPLTVIQDSLLYHGLVLYYQTKYGNFAKSADKYIKGFIDNTATHGDVQNGFYFHARTKGSNHVSVQTAYTTLLDGNSKDNHISEFFNFLNSHVGNN